MEPIRNEVTTSAMPAKGPGTLSPFVPPAEAHPDRGPGEPERLAKLVLQVSAVRKVDLRRIVHEKNECRRRHVCLRGIKKLQPFPWFAWRRMRRDGLFEHLVQRGRRHPS